MSRKDPTETLHRGAVLPQLTTEPSLNRSVSNGQSTPPQETVGQRLPGHAVFPRFSDLLSFTIERATYAQAGFGHELRVDHRRADIAVVEHFLDAADARMRHQD